MDSYLLQFDVFGDERGKLIALEKNQSVPFEIKRVFCMYETNICAERGKHANKFSQQVIICLAGSCSITVDDGKTKKRIILNNREEGLFIGTGLWKEIKDFSENCVLMVLTDTYYDEKEYIRDYDEFLREVGK